MKTVQFKNWICNVHVTRYMDNNRTALVLHSVETEEPIATATVNIPEATLAEDEVFIKNWSENKGILEALVKEGIIAEPHGFHSTGHVKADLCRLLLPIPEHHD